MGYGISQDLSPGTRSPLAKPLHAFTISTLFFSFKLISLFSHNQLKININRSLLNFTVFLQMSNTARGCGRQCGASETAFGGCTRPPGPSVRGRGFILSTSVLFSFSHSVLSTFFLSGQPLLPFSTTRFLFLDYIPRGKYGLKSESRAPPFAGWKPLHLTGWRYLMTGELWLGSKLRRV